MHLPPGHSSDRDLVEALRHSATRERAFRDVFRAWQAPLYGHLRRMLGNHEDAADAMQDAFVKFLRNVDDFRGDSALYSWLHTIANRTALDALRKRQRERDRWGDVTLDRGELSTAGPSDVLEPADDHAWNEWHGHDTWNEESALRILMEAVAALPDRQRAVFVLRYFEAMPYREMAQAMGVTESTLKTLYHHAKSKLRAALAS
jgi:RNA polymerase sigma-70 factor (ECF subfamily)